MATKVKKSHFSGSSKLFTVGDEGLANLIWELPQDLGNWAAAVSNLASKSGGPSGGNTIS